MKNYLLLASFILLISLGSWQLYRMNIKNKMISRMLLEQIKLESINGVWQKSYRLVKAPGVIDKRIFFNILYNGKEQKKFFPFTLLQKDGIILIDEESYNKYTFESTGYLICRKPNILRHLFKNDEKNNLWTIFDFERMSKIFGKRISPCTIQKQKPNIYNNHLEYAITWYILAFVVAISIVLTHIKKRSHMN